MADLRDELDDNLLEMLEQLKHFEGSSDERGDLVDDIAKLYKVRLEERQVDNAVEKDFDEYVDKLRGRREAVIGRFVDIGIAALKVGATIIGYCLISKMHANSIVADSYGTLQRSASFRIIPSINPEKNL